MRNLEGFFVGWFYYYNKVGKNDPKTQKLYILGNLINPVQKKPCLLKGQEFKNGYSIVSLQKNKQNKKTHIWNLKNYSALR